MSEKEENRAHPEIIIRESGSETEILINGARMEGVISKYSVEHEGGKTAKLTIDIPAAHMALEGRMIPALPEVFRPFYEVKRDPEEEAKELDEQDLHCMSRVLQGSIYTDGDMFHCCRYCQYQYGCHDSLKERKAIHFIEVRKKLQDITGVHLGMDAHNIKEKFLINSYQTTNKSAGTQ